MRLYTQKKVCCGCGACRDFCPTGAIRMVPDNEGFLYPQVEKDECLHCGRCEQVCPIKSVGTNASIKKSQTLYFGAQAKEDAIRQGSSSGGVFPLLAEYVFLHRGVVYGAAYDREMRVAHREASNTEELKALKCTKYVQSDLNGTYQKIERRLKEGKWVLFCGTPCQTRALRLYLGGAHPRLIFVDLVCYGVPSPGVWASYVKYLEDKSGGKMTDFAFRDKRNRDNGHTRTYVAGGRERTDSLYKDIYCRMYFENYIIRPSCHVCRFCTVDKGSDFTIGDFWGIERVRPNMGDGMGTSVIMVHTEKAREIWEQVRGELNWFTCKREDVLQPRLKSPTKAAKKRGLFMYLYKTLPFPLLCSLWNALAK